MYLQLIYYVLILQLYFNRKTYICTTNFSILISMIIKRHLLFICFHIVCIIKGQAQDITFGHLTTNEGLSNNAVMTMYQDERGLYGSEQEMEPISITEMNLKYINSKRTIPIV